MSALATEWPAQPHRPRGRFGFRDGALETVIAELTRRGRSQLWLAGEIGIDLGYLSRVNRRKQRLTRRVVEDCARILAMPADELFSPEDLSAMELHNAGRKHFNDRRARQFFQESYGVLTDEQWADVVAYATTLRNGGATWAKR